MRAYLQREIPDLPEETTASYRTHYERYKNWLASCASDADAIIAEYMALPPYVSQKDFALSITGHPKRSALFMLRQAETQTGDPTSARERVIAEVRKHRADELKERDIDDAIAS